MKWICIVINVFCLKYVFWCNKNFVVINIQILRFSHFLTNTIIGSKTSYRRARNFNAALINDVKLRG